MQNFYKFSSTSPNTFWFSGSNLIFFSFSSQAACGIANKPKPQIVDIDAADATNELAAVEYIEDMYKFYKLVEVYVVIIIDVHFFQSLNFFNLLLKVIFLQWTERDSPSWLHRFTARD